jgi:Bifunctional PLP-dependent enzyme with beta-cystathionase and maltose regulon repressor activities
MDFTRVIDRRPTTATKWQKYAGTDILPFWVADMEFKTAEPILDALKRRVDHGILGYTDVPESLTEATLSFLQNRYQWTVDPASILWLPGVVPGFNLACRCAGEPGDSILLTTPVYYPFFAAPENGGRSRLEVPLVRDGQRWVMDFDALEKPFVPIRACSCCAIRRIPRGGSTIRTSSWPSGPSRIGTTF